MTTNLRMNEPIEPISYPIHCSIEKLSQYFRGMYILYLCLSNCFNLLFADAEVLSLEIADGVTKSILGMVLVNIVSVSPTNPFEGYPSHPFSSTITK